MNKVDKIKLKKGSNDSIPGKDVAMINKLFHFLAIILLIPAIVFAAGTGKIKGKVVDKDSKEPLIGASVTIEGTTMGSASDIDGSYVIIRVPTGTYTLKANYLGYQTITISNVRVNNDLTTEINFELPVVGVIVPSVLIVAERPLVNKSATNAVRIIDNEFFSNLPTRGIDATIGIQPGVVTQNGNIYIRGGRPDETGFQLEGVPINDVLFGGRAVTFAAEAVEQLQVQAGGYGAEYGGANAGIINAQLRTGPANGWKASLLTETDNYTGQGKKSLGGYSYGYSDYTATVGGPVYGKDIRFFGSIENTFYRDPSNRLWNGLNFSGSNAVIADPAKTIYHPTESKADTLNLIYPTGNLKGGLSNSYSYSGTLLFDLGQVQVRGAGSYNTTTSRDAAGIANIFNMARTTKRISTDGLANIKVSHILNPKTFYEVNLNYYNNINTAEDPDFGGNINLYGDSTANAQRGYSFKAESTPWDAWSIFGGAPAGISINQPGTPISGFDRVKQIGLGGRADFTSQYEKNEFKVGGEYTRYTVRRFAPATIERAKVIRDHPSLQEQAKLLRQTGAGMDNYGYDVFGNEISNDIVDPLSGDITDYGPRHPIFAAGYVQDNMEFSNLILKIGLRYDYINSDSKQLVNPRNVKFNDTLKVISHNSIQNTPVTNQVSPRIGFSFPVTDRTVFHAQYGKFIQQSRLRDAYLGIGRSSNILKGGFFVQNTSGYGLKPERTTQYEMGFAQQLSDVASFDITAFYKDITDQIQYTQIIPEAGATQQSYASLINGDFSTSQGVEFTFTMRRTNRIQAQINYTFSDTRSTGSNPTALAGAVVASGQAGFIPKWVFPSTFNQPHRGSIMLDYRFAKDDGGPILERMGLNLLTRFNSGHSFTRERIDDPNVGDPRSRTPIEELGASSTPWFFELDARIDKTVNIGPFDANFYISVINLLGTDNPTDVFPRTGDPNDDGWLSITPGKDKISGLGSLGQQYQDLYRAVYLGRNANNFGPPRQIHFGVRIDY